MREDQIYERIMSRRSKETDEEIYDSCQDNLRAIRQEINKLENRKKELLNDAIADENDDEIDDINEEIDDCCEFEKAYTKAMSLLKNKCR